MVWPITEDIKIPTHWPLTKDKIRFAGDAVAVVVAETREQAEDAAEAVTVSATDLPVGQRPGGSGEGRGRAPRGPRHERRRALVARRRRRPVGVRFGAGDPAGALRPAPADPERDRDTRVPGVRHPRGRRVHAGDRDADPPHRSGRALDRDGHPAVEVAHHRARRGRRVRLEAERLRRGSAGARARAEDGASREVDRDAAGELPRHDPRPRRAARLHAGRHRRRRHPRHEVRRARRHGRLLPAADAGHPRARRLGVHGALRHEGVLVRVQGHHDERHADRRLPRRRSARGDVRDRATRRRVRDGRSGWTRPRCGGRTSCRRPRKRSARSWGSASTRRTTSPRSTGRWSSPSTTSCGRSSRRGATAAT